jgi:hypothetical protein
LSELNIPYIDFDVIKFRQEWLLIVEKIGVDILPTSLIKDVNSDDGKFFIPGQDYETEDEIVEILKSYLEK